MVLTWIVEFDDSARKELRKLDKQSQKEILKYLRDRIAVDDDPKRFGKPLSYDKHGLWRYRVKDLRVICRIEEDESIVLVVRVGSRREVYDF
jgi:mRNA interferase RelE/StbE